MSRFLIAAPFAALTLSLSSALAAPADSAVMEAIRADHWQEAAVLAARDRDPVAEKLVTFYRLLAPNAASAAEIDAFMTANPDWPFQNLLADRRDEALATESDDGAAKRACLMRRPDLAAALLRCAVAFQAGGNAAKATTFARAAWRHGIRLAEAGPQFLADWGAALTENDQWQRFDHFAWNNDLEATKRQIGRLVPPDRALARARLALADDSLDADALLASLPRHHRLDPILMLDEARWLESHGHYGQAAALWKREGSAAEAATSPDRLDAFWQARSALAYDLLAAGNARDAYAVSVDPLQRYGDAGAEAAFLPGFIALEFLHDPARATIQFAALAAYSHAAITQGRAHYWLAQAAAMHGDAAGARAQYEEAARWATTYYGQLAAYALDPSPAGFTSRIAAVAVDPPWTVAEAVGLAERELARAAALLIAWGAPERANAFLVQLGSLLPDPGALTLAAHLAQGFDDPFAAVMVARVAGMHGVMLPRVGWPAPFDPPAGSVPRPVIDGLIRQESSFDVQAVSSAGALGLMQLLPATAAEAARKARLPLSIPSLSTDPDYNIALGVHSFAGLMRQFDGVLPYAIAAYNAGPHKVDAWLAQNGDARTGPIDMIDWIELIPFSETRDYVQRVMENVVLYQVEEGKVATHPLAPWLK